MDIYEFIDTLPDRIAKAIEDDWRNKIQSEVSPAYQGLYEDNAKVEVESDGAIVCRLKKKVPNFVEHGLGPHLGDEGPYDLRTTALIPKGRTRMVVQVEPGKWRTMSVNGKPWVHPGFKAHRLMTKVQADIIKIVQGTLPGKK